MTGLSVRERKFGSLENFGIYVTFAKKIIFIIFKRNELKIGIF